MVVVIEVVEDNDQKADGRLEVVDIDGSDVKSFILPLNFEMTMLIIVSVWWMLM